MIQEWIALSIVALVAMRMVWLGLKPMLAPWVARWLLKRGRVAAAVKWQHSTEAGCGACSKGSH